MKKAIISGVWSVVSNSNATTPCSRSVSATAAKRNPPITGAGMLYRLSTPTRRRTPYPMNRMTAARASVCTMSSLKTRLVIGIRLTAFRA